MNTPKGTLPRAVAKAVENAERRAWYPLVLIFALAALGIFVGGALSYRNYERHFRTGIEQQLSAIAELKVAQIVQWRRERLVDANSLRRTPYVARRALDVLARPASPGTRQMFTAWLESQFADGHYEQVLLLDERLKVGLVYPEGTSSVLSDVALRAAQEALSSRQVVVADLHRETEDGPVYLSLMVPLVVRRESIGDRVPAAGKGPSPADRSAGLLVLQINAHKQFYPMIQLWPTPSRTAETLLVRRDGNDALFLNELKFETNTALRFRMSLERTNTPAVKAALGQEGVVDGIDYRGVPVVAALRAIPNSPWSMVARMDTAEVYAPLRERLWLTVLLMGALLLGAGASVGLVWRQQRVQFYRERYQAAEKIQQLSLAVEQNPALIVITDPAGNIEYVNPKFVAVTGYALAEVLGKNPRMLKSGEKGPEAYRELWQTITAGKEWRGEFRNKKKNGELYWESASISPIRDREARITHYVAVKEDITARKQTEAERVRLIQELQAALATVKSLSGLLPICAGCKKIRDDQGYWNQVEIYIQHHSEARFTHGLCPDCIKKYHPDLEEAAPQSR